MPVCFPYAPSLAHHLQTLACGLHLPDATADYALLYPSACSINAVLEGAM
jgi:hypothetical protein